MRARQSPYLAASRLWPYIFEPPPHETLSAWMMVPHATRTEGSFYLMVVSQVSISMTCSLRQACHHTLTLPAGKKVKNFECQILNRLKR